MSLRTEQQPLLRKNATGNGSGAYGDADTIPLTTSERNVGKEATTEIWKLPIKQRSNTGPLLSRLFAIPVFMLGILAIFLLQVPVLPLWPLLRIMGDKSIPGRIYNWDVERTKQMFGMLLILVFSLFSPTSITITTPSEENTSLPLSSLVVRDPRTAEPVGLNLPKNLVIMSNHQAYLDWMIIWFMGYISVAPAEEEGKQQWKDHGHGARSIIIILKEQLKKVPIAGWGMQFYRFIFLSRTWAKDRQNLTVALSDLCTRAQNRPQSGIWLTIFPEGTITSDEERAKSKKFSDREGIPDFINLLQPRSTGMLFCLRTLVPQMPDLRILDLTIGYPGVPRGGYAQEWYGLRSVFQLGVPPPTIHVHLRLIDPHDGSIPGILSASSPSTNANGRVVSPPELASDNEAKDFGEWIRGRWADKETLMDGFVKSGWKGFQDAQGGGDDKGSLYGGDSVSFPIQL